METHMFSLHREESGRAFSLLEVVIVVAIVSVLSAIAIPRMSRGAKGAQDSGLKDDLAVLRNAIDLYAAEHGGGFPLEPDIADQLTQYTDCDGDAQTTADSTHIYGPYLRAIPPLPVGARKGGTDIDQNDGEDVGWIYEGESGTITANCADSEIDDSGKKYNTY
jgi:prepilin-type N-terminal cleavage/methylation domain-containing protein